MIALLVAIAKAFGPLLASMLTGLFAQSPVQKVIVVQVEVQNAESQATQTGDSSGLDRVP